MSSSDALKPASSFSDRKAGVWAALTSFFLMWSFLYIVLIVFRPSWVCIARDVTLDTLSVGPKEALAIDQGRAFVVALIITLIVMLIVWLVVATAGASKSS
uniref:Uncharacterized protein n=1 Tax=viral metagenome TaxID=1070528 RepID=A0A6C0BES5_9ZZZZ